METLVGDLADPAYPQLLASAIGTRTIDALIHTAGLSSSMAEGECIMKVNYFATERLVEAARPKMAEGGRIVHLIQFGLHGFFAGRGCRNRVFGQRSRSKARAGQLA